jgi:hypothetical protein
MTSNETIESSTASDQPNDTWLQVTPGERLRIRVTSAQTMQAYFVIEVVADPHNGVPLHVHNNEEEHLIVLDGTSTCCAVRAGDSRQDSERTDNGNAFTTIALRNPWNEHRTAATAIASCCSAPNRANCSVHDQTRE